MQQDIEDFNSFFAGVLLIKKEIYNLEFMNLCYKFEKEYNISISSLTPDLLSFLIFEDDEKIMLVYDYDRILNSSGETVQEYLYGLTSDRVREFFKIEDINIRDNNTINKVKIKKHFDFKAAIANIF